MWKAMPKQQKREIPRTRVYIRHRWYPERTEQWTDALAEIPLEDKTGNVSVASEHLTTTVTSYNW